MDRQEFQPGEGKWVFVDWVGVEPGYGTRRDGQLSDGVYLPEGIRLIVHQPDVHPEMVLIPDKPWERNTLNPGGRGYISFLRDAGVYRCWYESGGGLAYAESDNGIDWKKPALRLREADGSSENNLCNISFHGHGLFIDPIAPADERYKMVGCRYDKTEKAIIGAVSKDGLEWKELAEPLVKHPQDADTQNAALYDAKLKKYVIYSRNAARNRTNRRGVNRTISDDFRCFPKTEPVLLNHPLDPPDWDIYCNGYSRWPGADDAHIMRLSMYERTSDTICVHLATSRDGVTWHRPHIGRGAWFGGEETPFGKQYQRIYGCAGIVDNGDGTWCSYFSATNKAHYDPRDTPDKKTGVLRGVIRQDGFVSLSARSHGRFYSVPFVLQSSSICVNVKTRHSGYLKYGLFEGDTVASGFGQDGVALSTAECDPISGDYTHIPLSWHGQTDISHLKGKTLRLVFEMFKTDLYSVTFL